MGILGGKECCWDQVEDKEYQRAVGIVREGKCCMKCLRMREVLQGLQQMDLACSKLPRAFPIPDPPNASLNPDGYLTNQGEK